MEMGVFLLVLVAVFIWGNLWFHLVESILGFVRRILTHHKKPTVWHAFPENEETEDD